MLASHCLLFAPSCLAPRVLSTCDPLNVRLASSAACLCFRPVTCDRAWGSIYVWGFARELPAETIQTEQIGFWFLTSFVSEFMSLVRVATSWLLRVSVVWPVVFIVNGASFFKWNSETLILGTHLNFVVSCILAQVCWECMGLFSLDIQSLHSWRPFVWSSAASAIFNVAGKQGTKVVIDANTTQQPHNGSHWITRWG